MIVSTPHPASLSIVCIRKIISLPNGTDESRYGTGFLRRGSDGSVWLFTNWHVLTCRRPDEPGALIGNAPQSPYAISVTFPARTAGAFLHPQTYQLYDNGVPNWHEYKRDAGVDVAGLKIELPPGAYGATIDDFNMMTDDPMSPGQDLISIGHPFGHSKDTPYPLWKRGMLASEPRYTLFGNPQMFIDTAGTPGLSGSPVFRSQKATLVSRDTAELVAKGERGEISSIDVLMRIKPDELKKSTIGLELVGIYAGSTSEKNLERLQLGRMYPASTTMLIMDGKGDVGHNPFPPQMHE